MFDIIYQYQQGYMPDNGNQFYFWVDCSKETYEAEKEEGGTVRLLYTAPPVPSLKLPDEKTNHIVDGVVFAGMAGRKRGFNEFLAEVKLLNGVTK